MFIAIIENDEGIREMLVSLFENKGHQVAAVSKVENLIINPSQLFDLILTDSKVAGRQVVSTCRMLEEKGLFHIPVIAMSGYTNISAECLQAGAAVFIEKPFNIDELLATVEDISARRKASGANMSPHIG
ncbi:response regulator [Foetidibacter luteolus]|uniref:response regulator n=1 Tax=Foetidibacter luteolus TaxID=2608880 RepID=UPI00129AFBB4|nr:response regulator [Foetidibacter luteolus]